MAHTRYPYAHASFSPANRPSNTPQGTPWHSVRPPQPQSPPFVAELEDTSPPRPYNTTSNRQNSVPPVLDVYIPSPTLSLWPLAAATNHRPISPRSPAPPAHDAPRAGEYSQTPPPHINPSQGCPAPPLGNPIRPGPARAWSFDVTDEYRFAAISYAPPAYTPLDAGLPPWLPWDRAPAYYGGDSATSDDLGSPLPSTASSELMERHFPSPPSSFLDEHGSGGLISADGVPEDMRPGLLPDEPSIQHAGRAADRGRGAERSR